jgi:hypothetical protein
VALHAGFALNALNTSKAGYVIWFARFNEQMCPDLHSSRQVHTIISRTLLEPSGFEATIEVNG